MTWKVIFDKGVACFKRGNLDDALAHMNQVKSDTRGVALYVP